MAGEDEIVERDGMLCDSVQEPISITLATKGANRAGFKHIRSDTEMSKRNRQVTRTKKRSGSTIVSAIRSDEKLAYLKLPEGSEEAAVNQIKEEYGIDDTYESYVEEGNLVFHLKTDKEVKAREKGMADGSILGIAKRSDLESEFLSLDKIKAGQESQPEEVEVENQRNDNESDSPQVDTPEYHGFSIASVSLDKEVFKQRSDVEVYLEENEIDYKKVDETETAFLAVRSDTTESPVVVPYGEGVSLTAVRADSIEQSSFLSKNGALEYLFGSYGMGQLNFNAYLADQEYTDKVNTLMGALEEVVYDILKNWWNLEELTLSRRKELITLAMKDFEVAAHAVIDDAKSKIEASGAEALNKLTNNEENEMATHNTRNDASAPEQSNNPESENTSATEAEEQQSAQTLGNMGIEDFTNVMTKAFAGAMEAHTQQRSDDQEATTEGQEAETSVDLASQLSSLQEQAQALNQKIENLSAVTVARSDPAPATAEPQQEVDSGGDKSFKGRLGW